jgi:hypothetical protein
VTTALSTKHSNLDTPECWSTRISNFVGFTVVPDISWITQSISHQLPHVMLPWIGLLSRLGSPIVYIHTLLVTYGVCNSVGSERLLGRGALGVLSFHLFHLQCLGSFSNINNDSRWHEMITLFNEQMRRCNMYTYS